ncbi:thiamine-phosphate kinase [Cupriavidus metallidurans]|jgi:thiamine-monophosphate kinase|uniref:thiamine-phosphate kinase n=1 Tax=Cupriavidus metallidurans TaxID=119219 RepID=UPI0007636298|nr:thiamine-phosphate kinase [Cupriavidus metallidurans]KWW34610.1 Thiamine-monophosphate kinase [Cupriavidus metallidurans]UBM10508.1 thiamine-phosphate kinase [Cupriavidus metallidurans]
MPESSPALSEFDLIRRYFTRPVHKAALGVGDDCALIEARPGHQLAISTDMLVSGRHFFPDVSPRALGHKALAVNLSDLAAMGAEPRAFTLALALPEADAGWLAEFAAGMLALADDHGCELIGGDTTKGPLTLSITVFGDVPPRQALRRDAARPGDDIWISGTLGDARLALGDCRGEWLLPEPDFTLIRPRMEMPTPRVALGLALRGVAHAALDISDGLIGDLGHILERSSVGAIVDVDALPRSEILDAQPEECQRACALAGGDDYELCFTAPVGARETIAGIARRLHLPLTHVGSITPEAGLRLVDREGNPYVFKGASFDHFAAP